MSGELTPDAPQPGADTPAPADPAPVESTPERSVAESLAATFDAIQKREGDTRGPNGQFQPREAPVAAAPGTESTDQPATQGDEPAKPAIEAPQSWSAEMKAAFPTLPPDVRDFIAKRESEAHAKISDQGNKLAAYDGLSRVLEPERNELLAAYGSEAKAVHDLLTLRKHALANPGQFIIQFARGAGVDLSQLPQLAASQPQAAPVDPRIAALSQQVESLTSIHRTQVHETAAQQVNAFKADPKNKHYATVESRIAELINTGAAGSGSPAEVLAKAYKMAVRENDQLLELEYADRAAQAKAKADAEAKRLATAARSANVVNIRTPGGRGGPQAPSSIRESLEKAYDKANGAA